MTAVEIIWDFVVVAVVVLLVLTAFRVSSQLTKTTFGVWVELCSN